MRISDWSSDGCSSDLPPARSPEPAPRSLPLGGPSRRARRNGHIGPWSVLLSSQRLVGPRTPSSGGNTVGSARTRAVVALPAVDALSIASVAPTAGPAAHRAPGVGSHHGTAPVRNVPPR